MGVIQVSSSYFVIQMDIKLKRSNIYF